jgi:hypothetical protein
MYNEIIILESNWKKCKWSIIIPIHYSLYLQLLSVLHLTIYLIAHYHVGNKSNTTGVTRGGGTTHPSGEPEFTSGF